VNKLRNSLERLKTQLLLGTKKVKVNGKTTDAETPLTNADITRIKYEIDILSQRLSGTTITRLKNQRKVKDSDIKEIKVNTKVIDIYSVTYGYGNKAAKKAAGKSRGKRIKMKKIKRMGFVKSVQMLDGILDKYRQGKMGLSPKHHVFKTRDTAVQPSPVQ